MTTYKLTRGLGTLAVTASLLATSACSETALTGFVDDSEIQDPDVVVFAALGISREHNDLLFGNNDGNFRDFFASDEIVHDGNSAYETSTSVGDFRDRRANWWHEQTHEALWASYKVVELAKLQFEPERFETSPIVARAWLNAGWSERLLADAMCETIYQYGPFGGFNLSGLGEVKYDRSVFAGKDSILERMAYAMEQAIVQADAAIAAGNLTNTEDAEYFDTQLIRTSAYAGLAEARVALASYGVEPAANYAAAAAAAAEVPNSAAEYWETTDDLRQNENWDISWDNDDFTAWAGEINGELWGSPAAYLRDGPDDPRAPIVKCAEFGTTDGDLGSIFTASNIVDGADVNDCLAEDSRLDTEGNYPKWLPGRESWAGQYNRLEVFRGTEMRLIEAEVALSQGDLGGFTSAINDARSFYGLDPIQQPSSIGALEFPNAEDDAWSILDREYLLDGWLEGRRMFHLDRWEHPFITQNLTGQPEHVGEVFGRWSCHPIPSNECNLNPNINCEVLVN